MRVLALLDRVLELVDAISPLRAMVMVAVTMFVHGAIAVVTIAIVTIAIVTIAIVTIALITIAITGHDAGIALAAIGAGVALGAGGACIVIAGPGVVSAVLAVVAQARPELVAAAGFLLRVAFGVSPALGGLFGAGGDGFGHAPHHVRASGVSTAAIVQRTLIERLCIPLGSNRALLQRLTAGSKVIGEFLIGSLDARLPRSAVVLASAG
jgi:hypothetical protein